jgi:hypothetical protein
VAHADAATSAAAPASRERNRIALQGTPISGAGAAR